MSEIEIEMDELVGALDVASRSLISAVMIVELRAARCALIHALPIPEIISEYVYF
jgi:hypothetical protein